MVVNTGKDLRTFLAETAPGGLSRILEAFAEGSATFAQELRRAPLEGKLVKTGAINVQSEEVHSLDAIGNDIFKYAYQKTGMVHAYVSEEEEKAVFFGPAAYDLYNDPADGSSNLDVAVPVGTIVIFYEHQGPYEDESVLLRPGREAVAAAYTICGTFTQIVLTLRHGVHIFTLDPDEGVWYLTDENVRYPEKTTYTSYNYGNKGKWPQEVQDKVEEISKGASGRYVGSLVADFHRNLLKGGFFCNPDGKLRLMYEANPKALIVEEAGGAAWGAEGSILDIVPTGLHQRTQLYIGSKQDIAKLA